MTLAACGGSTDVASSTVATSSTLVVGSLPTTTTPTTTTIAPTTTTAPSTPTTTVPANPTPASAFVAADEALLEVDTSTGETIGVLQEFFSADGVFRGGLRLSPDRQTLWFSEGYEDGWYACESSLGSLGRIDASTGEIEMLGIGSGVEPSPDGGLISYVTSSLCLPDPEVPDFWVLTPPDRLVVRTLETGEEREFVTDTPPDDYSSPSMVRSAWFSPDGGLLVLLGDGRLIDVDVDGSGVIQEHPVLLDAVTGVPVAATADALITSQFGDEGGTDVYSVDLVSGEATLIASAGAYMAIGVSDDDQVVVASFEPITVTPGADVTVLELPGNPFVYDIDW